MIYYTILYYTILSYHKHTCHIHTHILYLVRCVRGAAQDPNPGYTHHADLPQAAGQLIICIITINSCVTILLLLGVEVVYLLCVLSELTIRCSFIICRSCIVILVTLTVIVIIRVIVGIPA